MKINSERTITQMKNLIRPTLYWERKRLSRSLYFLKIEIVKEIKKSPILKYLEKFIKE